MPLTLPAEVNTEKNKIGHAPIILIDFVDLSYYVSSVDYSLDMNDLSTRQYSDFVKKGSNIAVAHKTSPQINGLTSTSNIGLKLLDFEGTLRTQILGSLPDLTDSSVKVYLKFNTTDGDEDNRLLLFSGIVDSYNIKNDVFTINLITAHLEDLPLLPATLAKDTYSNIEEGSDIAIPLQYGDFNWGLDPLYTGDLLNGYAVCPYVQTDDGQDIFVVSSHLMDEFPNTQAEVQSGTANTVEDATIFSFREGQKIHHSLEDITTVNTGSGCSFRLENSDDKIELSSFWLIPQANFASGEFANVGAVSSIDGKEATFDTIGDDVLTNYINMAGFRYSDSIRYSTTDHHLGFARFMSVWVRFEIITGTGNFCNLKIKRKGTHAVLYSGKFGSAGSGWSRPIATIPASEEQHFLDDAYIEVSTDAPETEEMKIFEVFVEYPVERWSVDGGDEACLYASCVGRQYSGTWESRKTAGNPILNPTDALESLFRDELGYSSFIDTASFGRMSYTQTVKACLSIVRQEESGTILEAFCKAFNVSIGVSSVGFVSLITPDPALDFDIAGGTPPEPMDILTDVDTYIGEACEQIPMKKDSFLVGRTSKTDKVSGIDLLYFRAFDGTYINKSSVGTDALAIENMFIGYVASAEIVRDFVYDFKNKQRWIVKVTTFLNAVDFQLGSVRNVEHNSLTANILGDAIVDKKWMVYGLKINLSKGLMDVSLIEIL